MFSTELNCDYGSIVAHTKPYPDIQTFEKVKKSIFFKGETSQDVVSTSRVPSSLF